MFIWDKTCQRRFQGGTPHHHHPHFKQSLTAHQLSTWNSHEEKTDNLCVPVQCMYLILYVIVMCLMYWTCSGDSIFSSLPSEAVAIIHWCIGKGEGIESFTPYGSRSKKTKEQQPNNLRMESLIKVYSPFNNDVLLSMDTIMAFVHIGDLMGTSLFTH